MADHNDILGIRPASEASKIAVQGTVDGARAFLGRICLPAAEEFGLLLQDHVKRWRADNTRKMLQKAKQLYQKLPNYSALHAHPRIIGEILENASWSDDNLVQSMWAGLLATSCTEDGRDETNHIFVKTLENLTREEVMLLTHFCENVIKKKSAAGWIVTQDPLIVSAEELGQLIGSSDLMKVDLYLDHLRDMGLTDSGFFPDLSTTEIRPSSLALSLYVRAQGFVGSAIEYFNL